MCEVLDKVEARGIEKGRAEVAMIKDAHTVVNLVREKCGLR